MNTKPRLTRMQLGEHLRNLGYPIGNSTLVKLCAPSIGQGPPVAAWWGNRPLYDPDEGVAWAEGRLRHVQPANTDIKEEAAEQEASAGVGPEQGSGGSRRRDCRRTGELASPAPRPLT